MFDVAVCAELISQIPQSTLGRLFRAYAEWIPSILANEVSRNQSTHIAKHIHVAPVLMGQSLAHVVLEHLGRPISGSAAEGSAHLGAGDEHNAGPAGSAEHLGHEQLGQQGGGDDAHVDHLFVLDERHLLEVARQHSAYIVNEEGDV